MNITFTARIRDKRYHVWKYTERNMKYIGTVEIGDHNSITVDLIDDFATETNNKLIADKFAAFYWKTRK